MELGKERTITQYLNLNNSILTEDAMRLSQCNPGLSSELSSTLPTEA